MDLEKLSDDEVNMLIDEAKTSLTNISINIPLVGKYNLDMRVKGETSNLIYTFHARRGKIENKYSMHIRFKETNTHLVRLCINGSAHHNSDGTKVSGNHLHIYKFNGQHPEAYAYSLKDYEFDESDPLDKAISNFIKLLHIEQ